MKSKYPKIELHSHLEGTITAETLIELSKSGHETLLPSYNAEQLKKIITAFDFAGFNKYFDITRPFRIKPQDISRVAHAEFKRAAQNGVI